MGLKDPMAVYTAANNLEAHCICQMLFAEGIEAATVEDESRVGNASIFGLMPGLHKPQVWVEKADAERARPLLAEFEETARRRELPADNWEPIKVVCEECGKATLFPASKLGAVETCPHCQSYVDVGEDCAIEGWDVAGHEEE